jgi:hypothetical protein
MVEPKLNHTIQSIIINFVILCFYYIQSFGL